MLVHINPPVLRICTEGSETDASYVTDYTGGVCNSFASDYIFQRLLQMHRDLIIVSAANTFYAECSSNEFGASTAGKMFEQVIL